MIPEEGVVIVTPVGVVVGNGKVGITAVVVVIGVEVSVGISTGSSGGSSVGGSVGGSVAMGVVATVVVITVSGIDASSSVAGARVSIGGV